MKLCLPLFLLVALVATLLHSTAAHMVCPEENCLDSMKCDDTIKGGTCPRSSDSCCSVVKREYRTACRHHGGECMDSCAKSLQRDVVDCPADKVCCTLV